MIIIKSNNLLKLIIIKVLFLSCSTKQESIMKSYPRAIGDITYMKSKDGEFERCGTYSQEITTSFYNSYYGTGGLKYKGEMHAIKKHIKENYPSPNIKNQTGFLTFRFLVNCKGETGMFRIYSTDLELKEFKFSEQITQPLLDAVKTLDGWQIVTSKNKKYDYYQYLTIKIIESQIKEITP